MTSTEWQGRTGLPRRALLKVGATVIASAALPDRGAFAAEGADMWARFKENVADFHEAAGRRRFTGGWDEPQPIVLAIRRPATEAEISEVERQIGEPLPKALRHFYANFASGITIQWWLPGRMMTTPQGQFRVELDEDGLPPPPFQKKSQDWLIKVEKLEPTILGGDISFSLEEIPDLLAEMRDTATGFRQSTADDEKLHFTRYAEWWERGFPLGFDVDGNMIAIDRQDEDGRMMFLAGDGADEPGRFIDHDLLDYMLIQSRLGFPGFRGIELGAFSAHNAGPGERERKYREERPGDVEAGLALPSTFRLDADSNDARIWRDWLGLKQE